MNRKLQLAILLVVFVGNYVLADVGESAGNEILNSNPGAKAMGLGGAFVGLADSLSAVQTNPAGLSYLTNPEILTFYKQGLFETQYAFFGFAKPFPFWPGTFACSVATLQDEDIDLNFTNPDGSFKETKTVKAGCDYLATLSYSQLIGKEVSVGINAKFLQSTLAEQYKATAYAGDIGFLLRPFDDRICFGFAARNFGTGLRYMKKEDSLQREYICGMAVRLFETNLNKLSFMGDYVKNEVNRFNLGFEYSFQKKIALRIGYRIGYDIGAFTAGFGLYFGGMGIDYAFVDRGEFDDSHIVSVNMKFGPASYYHTGENYFNRKMFERAINEWSKVSEGNPDYKKAHDGMNAARRAKEEVKGLPVKEKLKKEEQGIEDIDEEIRRLEQELFKKEEPVKELKEKKKKSLSPEDTKKLKSKHFNTATQLYKQEKYKEAITEWEKVLELDPGHKISLQKIEKAKEKLKK